MNFGEEDNKRTNDSHMEDEDLEAQVEHNSIEKEVPREVLPNTQTKGLLESGVESVTRFKTILFKKVDSLFCRGLFQFPNDKYGFQTTIMKDKELQE